MLVATIFVLLFLVLWLFLSLTGPAIDKLLARVAHWTTHFRYGDYLPVLVILAIGGTTAAMSGDAFVDLAELVRAQDTRLHDIDAEVHAWAGTAHTDGSTRFFTFMTIVGTPVGVGIIASAIGIGLMLRGRWRWAAYLAVSSIGGGALNLLLKTWFERARPDLAEALRHASGYSFPSGHAMGSTVVFGALAYLAFRMSTSWRRRAAAAALAITLIAAIATSRIYLGVHWISDIGAGIAAGTIWVVTTTVAYETFRRIRLIRELRARARAGGERSTL